jgi:pyrimidine deaminase RibD-like protein
VNPLTVFWVFMSPPIQFNEGQLMELAIEVAALSKCESDNRIHPKVGAVVSRNGYVLSTGYRGERYEGAHAEESALLKLKDHETIGATVYSTLEPCTTRATTPCSLLLIQRGIGRLVYAMLDPNPDIRGQGEWLLEERGVEIGKFPSDLVRAAKAQNAEFIDYMLGLGLTIKSPADAEAIGSDPVPVHGLFRVLPRPGDRIMLFGRSGAWYYPRMPIEWNREGGTWTCPRVFLRAADKPKPYGIVVARVSEDLAVWVRSYSAVHSLTNKWIGAEMPTLPPGFEVLASVDVVRAGQ